MRDRNYESVFTSADRTSIVPASGRQRYHPDIGGHASISGEILASYAADAAREVPGVSGLVGSALHRHDGVRVTREDERVGVELHLALSWGASAPEVGAEVQARVSDYLARMADVRPGTVDVVVDEFTPKR
jgi:uncharacterized alkaline shock family protein YloU